MKSMLIKYLFISAFAIILPPPNLLIWLGVSMFLDLVTGIAKAIKKGTPRTSTGYRRTVAKFIQYGGAIAIGIVLANISDYKKDGDGSQMIYTYFSNSMLLFIIYIEITSILENLIEVSPESDFTKKFLNPAHKLFSFDFKQFFTTEQKK
jgi:Bacteriophage holin family